MVRMRVAALVLILLGFLVRPSFANEEVAAIRIPDQCSKESINTIPDLRLHFDDVPDIDFLDNVTMTDLPRGSLSIRYEGFYKVLASKVRSELRSRARASLKAQYEGYVLNDDEYLVELDDLNFESNTSTIGRWWERNWWESLPQSKGGAKYYVHTIGSKSEIIHVGGLRITNDLHGKLVVPRDVTHDLRQLGRDISISNTKIRDQWRFRFRPAITARPFASTNILEIRDISFGFGVDVAEQNRSPWLRVDFNLKYRPPQNELVARVEVALISW